MASGSDGKSPAPSADFGRNWPVLDYEPTSKPSRHRGQVLTILWPAFEFQVVVPEPRERAINVFQKHIIGMTLSGARSAERIAGYLNLDPELVAFILLELRGSGMLDEDHELTPAGRKILEEENQVDVPRMTVGRVYQDPWTGKPWPRFLAGRPACRLDARFSDDGRVELRSGTVGNPRRVKAIRVRPDPGARPRPLEPREVLQACIDHAEARREYEAIARERADEDDGGASTAVADAWVDRVAQIGEQPTPVWLTTYIFIPEEIARGAYWRACDPFGLGSSDEMSERIDSRRDLDPLLRSEIARLTGQPLDSRPMSFGEMTALIDAEATTRVEDELTVAIRKYDRLFRAAIHMESRLIEARNSEPSLRGPRLMEVVNRAQVVLEMAFDELRKLHRTDRCYDRAGLVESDMDHNAAMFREIAAKVGFDRPPDSMVYVRLGKIRRAADRGDQSINPRLLAALLAAHRDPGHPLWASARAFPGMLVEVARVAQLRNEAGGAHAGSGEVALEIDQVDEAVKHAYRAVRALLPETRELRVQSQ